MHPPLYPFPSAFDVITAYEDRDSIREATEAEFQRRYRRHQAHKADVEAKHRKARQALDIWNAMCDKDVETVRQGLVDMCEDAVSRYERAGKCRYADVIELVKADIEALKAMEGNELLCAARLYLSPPLFD